MRVRLIPGHDPGAWTGVGSNSWFIDGDVPALIDTGSGEAGHLHALTEALGWESSGDERRLAAVLVTHAHPDHAGGAASIAQRWPATTFAKYPWPDRDARYPAPWRALADEELVAAGDATLWVVHTPGHAPDHLCFFEPRSGALFAGDLVMNGGTIVIPASHGGSLREYLQSLRRVLDLRPRRVYAGHGDVIEQPAALLRAYLAHRLSREQQIVGALRSGPLTVDAIVARIYERLVPGAAAAARESVLAHLRKLEEEGGTQMDEEGDPLSVRWRATGA
jgi:glyoxylase-like metal-dependent hydrolase (beta-lactamase superfamily II)